MMAPPIKMMPWLPPNAAKATHLIIHPHASTTHTKKDKRRLTFRPTVTVQPVDCKISPHEKSRSYYSAAELDRFSLEVKAIRALSRVLPDASLACDVHAAAQECLVGLEADPSLRGLEMHLCPTRVRNKTLARKAFLKYQKSVRSDPHASREEKDLALAAASAKLTLWARQLALETARHDSIRAYDGSDYRIPIRKPVVIKPFPVTKRRRVTTDDLEEEGPPAKRRRF